EVLIKVELAGLNFADTHTRTNSYVRKATLPLVPGGEVAGIREDTGERVVALVGSGGYAEYATAPAQLAFPIPDSLDGGTALRRRGLRCLLPRTRAVRAPGRLRDRLAAAQHAHDGLSAAPLARRRRLLSVCRHRASRLLRRRPAGAVRARGARGAARDRWRHLCARAGCAGAHRPEGASHDGQAAAGPRSLRATRKLRSRHGRNVRRSRA